MKLINKFKSHNFDKRRNNKILFIIIHYTALSSYKEAIDFLCSRKNKVSSHYLISQNGDIYNLVDDKKRAWHAGLSYWDEIEDMNSSSIGIELDFSENKLNNRFSKKMMNSLIKLLRLLKAKYAIKNSDILGHSDIAPFRKKDPGSKFPWLKLSNKNLVYINSKKNFTNKIKIKKWFFKNKIRSQKKITLFILSFIGYDTKKINNDSNLFSKLVLAYQTRFLISKPTGKMDKKSMDYLYSHFINIMLTKN